MPADGLANTKMLFGSLSHLRYPAVTTGDGFVGSAHERSSSGGNATSEAWHAYLCPLEKFRVGKGMNRGMVDRTESDTLFEGKKGRQRNQLRDIAQDRMRDKTWLHGWATSQRTKGNSVFMCLLGCADAKDWSIEGAAPRPLG